MNASKEYTTNPIGRPSRGARVTFKRDRRGEWRWKLQAANFEVVSSGEGYRTFAGAQRGYKAMVNAVMNAREVVVDEQR